MKLKLMCQGWQPWLAITVECGEMVSLEYDIVYHLLIILAMSTAYSLPVY